MRYPLAAVAFPGDPIMIPETVLKRFENPDEVRTFEKGKFEIVRIGGMTIGRATYQPGWKWSVDVGPGIGASRCNVEHVGLVLLGCATPGHDSWVVGDEPDVSLHFMGSTPREVTHQS